MTRFLRRTLVLLMVFAFVFVPYPALAQDQPDLPLPPTVYEGSFTNADYQIAVPNPIERWNGVLLVFAHGYTFELQPAAAGPSPEMVVGLAQAGYAVAGSAFRNGGWAVKEGLQNTLALTNRFNGLVGKPERTILWGFSMGSVITLKGIEKYPGIYDGALTGCNVGGGTPVAADLALDLALAYDVTFGWPEQWGTPGDVRDDLVYDPDVLSVIAPQILSVQFDPLALAKFEFIRRVLDLPANDFYPDAADPVSRPGGFLVDMAFATQARAEIEQRANGAVSQNRDHVYSLAYEDFLAVGGLGGDPVQWLARMNAATSYEARRPSREYVERYAAFAGDLKRPVLTLHTTVDPINPPFHELLYAETVNAAGSSNLLHQLYTDGVGHCQFTGPQLVAAILGVEAYLQYGGWPPNEFFAAAGGYDFTYAPPQPYYRPVSVSDLDAAIRSGAAAGTLLYLPLAIK